MIPLERACTSGGKQQGLRPGGEQEQPLTGICFRSVAARCTQGQTQEISYSVGGAVPHGALPAEEIYGWDLLAEISTRCIVTHAVIGSFPIDICAVCWVAVKIRPLPFRREQQAAVPEPNGIRVPEGQLIGAWQEIHAADKFRCAQQFHFCRVAQISDHEGHRIEN